MPRLILLLAGTELWERFTYYGMRALLVLCLTGPLASGGFGLADPDGTAIYGLFVAGVYLSALPGGWLADHWLGAVRCIWAGGLLIAAGNLLLALAVRLGGFAAGLACIALGVGLLKPNITTLVARASAGGRVTIDSAFTIFYVGINIGGMAGPLVAAALAAVTGWRGGFVAAAAGMLIGLLAFSRVAGRFADPLRQPAPARPLLLVLAAIAGVLAVLAAVPVVVAVRGAIVLVVGAMALAIGMLFRATTSAGERSNLRLFVLLLGGATLFWTAGEQAGTTLTLFAQRLTDRRVGSWEFPAAWYQALYPLYVIVLAPLFVWLWQRLAAAGRDPPAGRKFGVGLLGAATGLVVAAAAAAQAAAGPVHPGWLAATYLFLALGELCLGPVGLAAGTRFAPPSHQGLATGVWFLSLALGGLLAGMTGSLFDVGTAPGVAWACGSIAAALGLAGGAFLLRRGGPAG